MTYTLRYRLSLLLGLLAMIMLVAVSVQPGAALSSLPLLLAFSLLIAFASAYSVPVGGGDVSLMPMTVASAYLVMGKVATGWAVLVASLAYAVVRYRRGRLHPELQEPRGPALVEATALNFAMHSLGIFAAALAFESLGGQVPLRDVGPPVVWLLVLSAVVYLAVNHALVAGYFAARSRDALQTYLHSVPVVIAYEGGPMIWAPLVAIVYTRLGWGFFTLFALALVVTSWITHTLGVTSRRLQRRIRELSGLQAVGQALSASLDVERVVTAVYEQVQDLMPADSFYVALYDADTGEVSFPITVEEGVRRVGRSRRARRGLTEYIVETGEPLLIPRDVGRHIEALGLERHGRASESWLGVPIVAGEDVLGVIAVQSYTAPALFDRSHLDILKTIGAQAAIAIENARLYERTDEALARRVQELDSVLRTTHDGVILLDLALRLVTINRAMADLIDVAQSDVMRHPVDALRLDGEAVVRRICYTMEELEADCARLRRGEAEQADAVVVLQPSGRHVSRALTPVRDTQGRITGWLLIFRDLTEELELARLRDDLTGMLVHDLRSPMSLISASLAMIEERIESFEPPGEGGASAEEGGWTDQIARLVGIAQRSGDRVMTLIDDLLDIGQLERGQLPMNCEDIQLPELLREIAARYRPAAAAHGIELQVDSARELPTLSADRSLMTRVLANLVDNALKFTPDGGEIVLRAEPDGSRVGAGRVVISVRDTGPGIPVEARAQLFEKFQQIPSIRGRRRGTGLGLPFCKLVVEAHGGQIWVESEVGWGSTFTVALPIDGPRAVPPADTG